ncbi:hypothetical protein QQ045_015442 [Rhodiola kirilowii]
MAPARVGWLSPEILEKITNGFCEDNCIGRFQFGKLYRGVGDDSNLIVKVYNKVDYYEVRPGDNEGRRHDEDCLTYEDYVISHPNMVKIYALSFPTERPAVIYEVQALDTVHNLLEKDSFSWLERVKVAYGFASIVAHMHDFRPIPYIIRNISAAHILLDQEYNPKLYDFSMISGGNLVDKREVLNQYLNGCHGYADPDYIRNGKWSEKCDVFAYGVVLLCLISKKVVEDKPKQINPEPFLYEWAHTKYQKKITGKEFEGCKYSLVHTGFEAESFFCMTDGVILTKLAMKCLDYNPMKRPTMKQVVGILSKLSIIQNHANLFSFGNALTAPNFSIYGIGKLMSKKLKTYSKIENLQKAWVKKLMGKDNVQLTTKDIHFRAPMILSYEDLEKFTDGFSEENYIDIHQFGKLYHGRVQSKAVTVKTWEDVDTLTLCEGDNEIRLRDELVMLQHPKFISHPHIVKLIGYCYEDGRLATVYDLESLDCLVNLIETDSFNWRCRMDFAVKLADLLKFLQSSNPPYEPYVLRNLFPNNILVDKDYNPKLFNFGLLEGGILNEKEDYSVQRLHCWRYYIDPYTNCYDYYTEVSDIFSFGMVLLNLITKKIDMDNNGCIKHYWAYDEFEKAALGGRWGLKHFSLAEKSFGVERDFDFGQGHRVSKLVMRCIDREYSKRPTIDQIVNHLEKLTRRLNSILINGFHRRASFISEPVVGALYAPCDARRRRYRCNSICQKFEEAIQVRYPERIYGSMRYSVLAKGAKRAPPVMCVAACELFGGDREAAFPTACPLEMQQQVRSALHRCPCFQKGKPKSASTRNNSDATDRNREDANHLEIVNRSG